MQHTVLYFVLYISALPMCKHGCMQILGRGDHPKAFIRHGQSEASTEITLSSGSLGRPLVIRRLLKLDNTNEWRINGGARCQPAAHMCKV